MTDARLTFRGRLYDARRPCWSSVWVLNGRGSHVVPRGCSAPHMWTTQQVFMLFQTIFSLVFMSNTSFYYFINIKGNIADFCIKRPVKETLKVSCWIFKQFPLIRSCNNYNPGMHKGLENIFCEHPQIFIRRRNWFGIKTKTYAELLVTSTWFRLEFCQFYVLFF